jgi:multiple sugar transport system substrate-binding protein
MSGHRQAERHDVLPAGDVKEQIEVMKHSSFQTARRMSGLLAILTLVALLAACGSGSSGNGSTGGGIKGPHNTLLKCPTGTNTTAAAAESGDVTLNVTGWSSSPAEDALVQQGFDNFTKKYPKIHVKWSPIPDAYDTKMRANVASGNVADVFYLQPPMAQEYIPSGKLLNLSPYMARDNVAASTYYDSLLQPFDCADGTVYGIPKDWNTLGLVYNKTMLQAAGLSDPSTWSWSDLQNAAQKMTQGAVKGIALPPDASRMGAFLVASGGQMLSSDGKSAAFNNSVGVDAATYYTSFEKNKTGAMPKDLGAGWDGEAFGKQQVAMTIEGGWLIPFMAKTYPSVQYGIVPLPKSASGQRGNLIFTNAWAAYSKTQHPDAAWKLIQYMTGQEYQTQVLHAGFALPTIQSLASDSYFSDHPDVKALADGAAYGKADFYGPADSQIHSELANALEAVMLNKSDVKAALDTAAQNVNTWIQQNTAP